MNNELENLPVVFEAAQASLIIPNIIGPALRKMEREENMKGAAHLRSVFLKADAQYPNLAYDLINEMIKLQSSKSINLNEMLLRSSENYMSNEYRIDRPEFEELNERARQLKLILSRIPNEINDRKAFLETIKEIAAAIKKKLDAVNNLFETIQVYETKQILDIRKREFVKYSKQFSNTLKAYFRQGNTDEVFSAANCLISQTNLILKTLKIEFDNVPV